MGTPEYDEYLRKVRCGHKIQFSGKLPASNFALALSWKEGADIPDMEAYLCEFCDHWHIGHPRFRMALALVPIFATDES